MAKRTKRTIDNGAKPVVMNEPWRAYTDQKINPKLVDLQEQMDKSLQENEFLKQDMDYLRDTMHALEIKHENLFKKVQAMDKQEMNKRMSLAVEKDVKEIKELNERVAHLELDEIEQTIKKVASPTNQAANSAPKEYYAASVLADSTDDKFDPAVGLTKVLDNVAKDAAKTRLKVIPYGSPFILGNRLYSLYTLEPK